MTVKMPHPVSDGPLTKRQRTEGAVKRAQATDNGSKIFAPFRVSSPSCGTSS